MTGEREIMEESERKGVLELGRIVKLKISDVK